MSTATTPYDTATQAHAALIGLLEAGRIPEALDAAGFTAKASEAETTIVSVASTAPLANGQKTTLRWKYERDAEGTRVTRRPPAPGHDADFYATAQRVVKAAKLIAAVMSTESSLRPVDVSDGLLVSTAARIGIRPPSMQTCDLVRAMLAAT
ncbi:hypothetical protein ACIGO9_30660 [Nocardia asteroides]|uniref:hypothetical protein n=1 Tax=Nocardia asteroides TaxID=1824 RepID=UPI0037C61252